MQNSLLLQLLLLSSVVSLGSVHPAGAMMLFDKPYKPAMPFKPVKPEIGPMFDAGGLFSGYLIEQTYKTINKFLQKRLPFNEDANLNLNKSREWLNMVKAESEPPKELVKALEQFTALAAINSTNQCSSASYEILNKNYEATKAMDKDNWTRRTEIVLSQVAQKHAADCRTVYPTKFKKINSTMNQTAVDLVDSYMSDIIVRRIELKASEKFEDDKSSETLNGFLYENFIQDGKSLDDLNLARVTYSWLKENSYISDEPHRPWRHLGKKSERFTRGPFNGWVYSEPIIGRYILEPCRHFQTKLGPDVFVPARLDMQTYERRGQGSYRMSSEDNEYDQFYLSWAYFRLCEKLLTTNKIDKLLAQVEFMMKTKGL